MSQGKAFTEEQRNTIMESLREYLELGFSRNRACKMVGLEPTTLSKWCQKDESLSMKVSGWENAINKLATQNLVDGLMKEAESDDARKELSKWWAERRMRNDFATKVEEKSEQNTKLFIQFDSAFDDEQPE